MLDALPFKRGCGYTRLGVKGLLELLDFTAVAKLVILQHESYIISTHKLNDHSVHAHTVILKNIYSREPLIRTSVI